VSAALGLGARVLCVFVLLAAVLWVLKRTDGLGARRRVTPVQVLSTARLGKAATLSVVRVHDEEHVLAVSGSAVTVVATRPAPLAVTAPAGPAALPVDAAGADAGADPARPAATARPVPPSAAEFLRGGWQVLRKQPVASTELDDDEVRTALARACTLAAPTAGAGDFAADLALALRAVEPAAHERPVTDEQPPAALPAPRAAGDLAAARAPHRCRTEARPAHLRVPRRAALRPVEDGAA